VQNDEITEPVHHDSKNDNSEKDDDTETENDNVAYLYAAYVNADSNLPYEDKTEITKVLGQNGESNVNQIVKMNDGDNADQ
jgi:hypothetical protein